MADETIRVEGIVELQRALRQVSKDAPKELASELASVAEFVLQRARPLVPRKSGSAQGSMKVRKQQRGAALAVGGSKAEYFPFLDWGNKVRSGHGVGRGDSVPRPFIQGEGRYVYKTVKDNDVEIRRMVDVVLKKMAVKAGFETSGRGDQ